MWFYDNVSRADFEAVKDMVEKIMLQLGASVYEVQLPYEVKTTCYSGNFEDTHYSKRSTYAFNGLYFRVDEVLFSKKPFIVIECGDLDELLQNTMEDAEPFPYDLSLEEITNEVKYSLGIEPYPKQ